VLTAREAAGGQTRQHTGRGTQNGLRSNCGKRFRGIARRAFYGVIVTASSVMTSRSKWRSLAFRKYLKRRERHNSMRTSSGHWHDSRRVSGPRDRLQRSVIASATEVLSGVLSCLAHPSAGEGRAGESFGAAAGVGASGSSAAGWRATSSVRTSSRVRGQGTALRNLFEVFTSVRSA
jgi:hypothetical protein